MEESKKKNVLVLFFVVLLWTTLAYVFSTVSFELFRLLVRTEGSIDFSQLLRESVIDGFGLPLPVSIVVLGITIVLGIICGLKKIGRSVVGLFGPIFLVGSALAFFVFLQPCEGLGCIGHGLVVFIYQPLLFVAIAVLPIAWGSMRSDKGVNTRFVVQSVYMGFLVIGIGVIILTPILLDTLSDFRNNQARSERFQSDLSEIDPRIVNAEPKTAEESLRAFLDVCKELKTSPENVVVFEEFRRLRSSIKNYMENDQQAVYEAIVSGEILERASDKSVGHSIRDYDPDKIDFFFDLGEIKSDGLVPSDLIIAATEKGETIEIQQEYLSGDSGIVFSVALSYEGIPLTFLFPTCGGTYYEVNL